MKIQWKMLWLVLFFVPGMMFGQTPSAKTGPTKKPITGIAGYKLGDEYKPSGLRSQNAKSEKPIELGDSITYQVAPKADKKNYKVIELETWKGKVRRLEGAIAAKHETAAAKTLQKMAKDSIRTYSASETEYELEEDSFTFERDGRILRLFVDSDVEVTTRFGGGSTSVVRVQCEDRTIGAPPEEEQKPAETKSVSKKSDDGEDALMDDILSEN